jgi:hypothetical protein
MRKVFSFFVILMLVRFEAAGQTSPTLQIAETNGAAAVSWSVGPFPYYLLQATTNLSPPITWSNQSFAFNTGTFNVTMSNSQQFFRLAEITPIFQFAIFYNLNMEIQPGSGMNIGGPVFCNASIWAASSSLTFSNSVNAVGFISTNYMSSGDPFMTPGAKTGSGYPHFIVPPIPGAGVLSFLGTNNDPAAIEALLRLPPMPLGSDSAYSPTGSIYFANQAGLIITNSSSGGTNIQVFYQDDYNAPALTLIPKDMTNYYSFVTSTNFYDYRESKIVSAIYLNVTNLDIWLTNTASLGGHRYNFQSLIDTGEGINSIYIYNSVPMSSSTLPAVQVDNGAQLPPYGLGIATPDPLYVKGNFNTQTNNSNSDAGLNDTTYTYPAALYADAVTVLSAHWNDTNYISSTPLPNRVPVTTTINAAVFEGIVPSSGSNYSGGVENFLRLEENWNSSFPLTYNGSIVVMFPSQYATNIWNGSVYGVPKRQWAFDPNFTNVSGLPPLTPLVLNLISP